MSNEMTSNTIERWEEIYNFIKGYATMHKLRNTLIALSLGVKCHSGDKRDGGEPYIIHPLMVAKTLILLNIEQVLRDWYPDKNWEEIKRDCDILYAAAILHDTVEDGKISKHARELVEVYHLDEDVRKVVLLLSKDKESEGYSDEKYFDEIKTDWRAILAKIADRQNNCSTMIVFKEERLKKYIYETKRYYYPLCSYCKIEFPEFSSVVTIMKSSIVACCETIASLIGMTDIVSDVEQYHKTINFIEGASRNSMPNTSKALYVAIKLHGGQIRKSGDAFIIHPLRVCSYLLSLGVEDDETCALALLHEITKKCKLKQYGLELVNMYGINEEVIEMVWTVSNKKDLSIEQYYEELKKSSKTLLMKLANRAHTCTMLINVSIEEKIKYIEETRKCMIPMCEYGMMHYPEYANMIEIMQYHITTICNIVEALVRKQSTSVKEAM